jgi:hypothetical protein
LVVGIPHGLISDFPDRLKRGCPNCFNFEIRYDLVYRRGSLM